MIPVILFLAGAWAASWGLYSVTVARNPLRRHVAAVTGPAGVLLMAGALVAFLAPGFFA